MGVPRCLRRLSPFRTRLNMSSISTSHRAKRAEPAAPPRRTDRGAPPTCSQDLIMEKASGELVQIDSRALSGARSSLGRSPAPLSGRPLALAASGPTQHEDAAAHVRTASFRVSMRLCWEWRLVCLAVSQANILQHMHFWENQGGPKAWGSRFITGLIAFCSQQFSYSNPHVERCSNFPPWDLPSSPQA
jgi:hypothetical protein